MKYERHLGNYAVALSKLRQGQTFSTPRQGMEDRIVRGVGSDPCNRWAWFNACICEINGELYATKAEFNPLSAQDEQGRFLYAQRAVDAMRNSEFYLTSDVLLENEPTTQVLLRIAEQDRKKPMHLKRVLCLGQERTHDVPTDCFGDDKTIVFYAEGKKFAEKYGKFVRNAFGKNSIPTSRVYMQNLTGKDKIRGFALGRVGTDGRSNFNCDNRYLNSDNGSVFGGYESAEGDAKNLEGKTSDRGLITRPSLGEVLRFSRKYVPQAVKKEFEDGLREKYK
jgi:hypothetical protein